MKMNNFPTFIGWKYPDGSIRITVEGIGEHIDGVDLFTYTPMAGVEIGSSKLLAFEGQPSIVVFKGNYADQRTRFDAWRLLTEEQPVGDPPYRRNGGARQIRSGAHAAAA